MIICLINYNSFLVRNPTHPTGISLFDITGANGHDIIEKALGNRLPKFTMGLE